MGVLPSTDKKMQEGAAGESLVNRQLNGEGEKPAKIDAACVLEKARKAEIEIKQVEAQAAELGARMVEASRQAKTQQVISEDQGSSQSVNMTNKASKITEDKKNQENLG